MGALADLLAAAGMTPQQAGVALGVDPLLLVRVDAGRQPLPAELAPPIAALAGSDAGTVLGTAGLVTRLGGPTQRVPVPPDPLLGDALTAQPVARLRVPPPVPRSEVLVMVVGQGVGPVGGVGGFALLDRALGPVVRNSFATLQYPDEVVLGPGGAAWTYSGLTGGTRDGATVSLQGAVTAEVPDASAAGGVNSLTYVPDTDEVWGCTPSGLLVVSALLPSVVSALLPVSVGASSAAPVTCCYANGKVYATALVPSTTTGALVEFDPTTRLQTRTSTGTNPTQFVYGVAFDGADTFVLAARSRLFRVSLSTFTCAAHVLSGGTVPVLGTWVAFAGGSLWVSDQASPSLLPRLIRAERNGDGLWIQTVADLTLGTTVGGIAGHVVVDEDGFIWASNPIDGTVRILDPTVTTGDPTAHSFAVGGAPQGLLVL